MAIDERNFRSAYYEKVGFKSVEEKRSLDILLKEKQLDVTKLKQFCLRFVVPAGHRGLMWKLLLGILPIQETCREFVTEQKKQEYNNLLRTITVMRLTRTDSRTRNFLTMWLLQTGNLQFNEDFDSERSLFVIFSTMATFFKDDVDIYWVSRAFYNTVQKYKCEVPKLIEATCSLIEKEDVQLYEYLQKNNILENLPLNMYFDSCFSGVLYDQFIGKIWDKVCGGSYKILSYVMAVLLITIKHNLMKCPDTKSIATLILNVTPEASEVIANKSVELWQKQGSPLTVYDKPKP